MTMMLPHGLLSEPMLAFLMSALSHQDVSAKMENFIWQPNKLNETLAVLQLVESQCPTNYNLVKVAKLDNSNDGDRSTERPSRAETMVVMKVIQTLTPASNAAALDMLKTLRALEQPERGEQDLFSLEQTEQVTRPLPTPTQVMASIRMIVGELRHIQWYGTLRDVHERVNVSHETMTGSFNETVR